MNKKTVIIHGGFHKTASSTIQHSLGDNRSDLETQGFLYPFFDMSGKEFFNRSLPISGLYMDEPEKFRQYWYHNQVDPVDTNEKQHEVFNKALDSGSSLILSDEFISNLDENILLKLKGDIVAKGYDVRFISYIREPLSLIISSTQQMARTGNRLKSKDFIKLKKTGKKIKKIQEAFGEAAEFHSFEKACKHKDGPAGYFFDLIGFKYKPEKIVRINEGVSAQAVNLLSYMNELQPLFIGDTINPVRRRFDNQFLLEMPGDKYSFTKEQVEKISDQVGAARAEIVSLLGEDFLPETATKLIDKVVWSEAQFLYLNKVRCELDLNVLIKIADFLNTLELSAPLLSMKCEFENYVGTRLRSELSSKRAEPLQRIICRVSHLIKKLKK